MLVVKDWETKLEFFMEITQIGHQINYQYKIEIKIQNQNQLVKTKKMIKILKILNITKILENDKQEVKINSMF